MDHKKVFGTVVKNIREQKYISQDELASISGLDRTFISLIENGKRSPTLTTILKLSKGLAVKPSYLIKKCEEECIED